MGIIYLIIVGAIAGWLAGQILKGKGFGLIMNVILGIIGGIVGGFVTNLLNIHLGTGVLGHIIDATLGAVIVLFLASRFK